MQTTLDKHIFSFPTTENEKMREIQEQYSKNQSDSYKGYENYLIYDGKYCKYTIDDDGWYGLMYIDSFNQNKTINQRINPKTERSKIKQINLKDLQNIKRLLDFQKKYNDRIKCKGLAVPLLDFDRLLKINEFFQLKTGLKHEQLKDIIYAVERTPNICIHNIFSSPFDFITEEEQYITFHTADKICDVLSLTIPFEIKCQKWSFYNIIHKYKSFYVEPRFFDKDFKELCDKNNKKYEEYKKIINATVTNIEIKGVRYITTQYLYDFEINITKQFIDLFLDEPCSSTSILDSQLDNLIIEYETYESRETKKQFSLESEQKKAVKNSIINKFSLITGFPGTGKSSIVKCILYIESKLNPITGNMQIHSTEKYKYTNKGVSVLSPTGIAYINIKKKCEINYRGINDIVLFNPNISGTCHRVLLNTYHQIKKKDTDDYYDSDNEKEKDTGKETSIVEPSIIIVDEASMLDIFMFKKLLYYCKKFDCKLILIGDNNQLPSIGAGNVLDNLIKCYYKEISNVSKLTEIKRQDSGVLMTNIKKMIISGITKDDFTDDTMKFIDINSFVKENRIDNACLQRFIEEHDLDETNCKFISYFNGDSDKSKNHCSNVLDLNKSLQNIFNPDGSELFEKRQYKFNFRTNDVVMRVENNNSGDAFRANGEIAQITDCDKNGVSVLYETDENDARKCVRYEYEMFYEDFRPAYALTVHKSQGSQFKNIIIFIENNSYPWDINALYTAISRAQERCFIIGNHREFIKIQQIKNNKISLFLHKSHIDENYDIE
jgi:hypothetical protein